MPPLHRTEYGYGVPSEVLSMTSGLRIYCISPEVSGSRSCLCDPSYHKINTDLTCAFIWWVSFERSLNWIILGWSAHRWEEMYCTVHLCIYLLRWQFCGGFLHKLHPHRLIWVQRWLQAIRINSSMLNKKAKPGRSQPAGTVHNWPNEQSRHMYQIILILARNYIFTWRPAKKSAEGWPAVIF